jgi:hypothetical protein
VRSKPHGQARKRLIFAYDAVLRFSAARHSRPVRAALPWQMRDMRTPKGNCQSVRRAASRQRMLSRTRLRAESPPRLRRRCAAARRRFYADIADSACHACRDRRDTKQRGAQQAPSIIPAVFLALKEYAAKSYGDAVRYGAGDVIDTVLKKARAAFSAPDARAPSSSLPRDLMPPLIAACSAAPIMAEPSHAASAHAASSTPVCRCRICAAPKQRRMRADYSSLMPTPVTRIAARSTPERWSTRPPPSFPRHSSSSW